MLTLVRQLKALIVLRDLLHEPSAMVENPRFFDRDVSRSPEIKGLQRSGKGEVLPSLLQS